MWRSHNSGVTNLIIMYDFDQRVVLVVLTVAGILVEPFADILGRTTPDG